MSPGPGLRLAILDDYQDFTHSWARFAEIPNVDATAFTDHVADEDALVARLGNCDVVMRIRERTPFPATLLRRLPKLKLLLATGMRNAGSIDLPAADELEITVCATEAHHQSTVEIVWGLVLDAYRGISREQASVRAGGWQVGLGTALAGQTLGIMGLGNMGTPVAAIGKILGMKVIAWSPNLTPERASAHGAQRVDKQTLFAASDVITLHMPLMDSTRGIVGEGELAAMRSGALLVNTSRAGLVDGGALIAAVSQRRIRLAVDVFETEPLPADHPFRSLPNVLATPHIGFVTEENLRQMFDESLENLKAYIAGSPMRTINAVHPFLANAQATRPGEGSDSNAR